VSRGDLEDQLTLLLIARLQASPSRARRAAAEIMSAVRQHVSATLAQAGLAGAAPGSSYLSIAQVAARLGAGEKVVRRLIQEGVLQHRMVGRSYRIPESSLQDFLAERESDGH
jgi:excisionase family DNA binding protein